MFKNIKRGRTYEARESGANEHMNLRIPSKIEPLGFPRRHTHTGRSRHGTTTKTDQTLPKSTLRKKNKERMHGKTCIQKRKRPKEHKIQQ